MALSLSVVTRGGLPGFSLEASPHNRVEVVEAAAALRVGIAREDVRLSYKGQLLSSGDALGSLGLSHGAEVLLHVRMGTHSTVTHPGTKSSRQGSTNSASRETSGQGFHVNIIMANGKQFYRPQVLPDDDASRVIDDAVSRIKKAPDGPPVPHGGKMAQLFFRGAPIKRGKTIKSHGIGAGAELVLHLESPYEAPASAAYGGSIGGSVGGIDGRIGGGSGSGSGAAKKKSSAATPYGAKKATAKGGGSGYGASSGSSSYTSTMGKEGTKRWTATQGGYKLVHVSNADAKDDQFSVAIDADVQHAADMMYDAVHIEVAELKRTNRKLRNRLRYAVYEGSNSESSCTDETSDSDDSVDDDRKYGRRRREHRSSSRSGHRSRSREAGRDAGAAYSFNGKPMGDLPYFKPGSGGAGSAAARKGAATGVASSGSRTGSGKGVVAARGGKLTTGSSRSGSSSSKAARPTSATPTSATPTTTTSKSSSGGIAKATVETFDKYDKNRSGFIDYKELRRALASYGLKLENDHAAQNILHAYDSNPDGKLELSEFDLLIKDLEKGHLKDGSSSGVAARAKSASSSAEGGGGRGGALSGKKLAGGRPRVEVTAEVEATFDAFDTNRSGYLDYRELRNALEHYGLSVTTPTAQEILTAYDDHPDGKLEVAEFAQLVADIGSGATKLPSSSSDHHHYYEGGEGGISRSYEAYYDHGGYPMPVTVVQHHPPPYGGGRGGGGGGGGSGRTPVGQMYDEWRGQRYPQQQQHHPQQLGGSGGGEERWSATRRANEAALLRKLDRELRDEALSEQLLSEQLVEEERTEAEREAELTELLVGELEREILDEKVAMDLLMENLELDDTTEAERQYEAWLRAVYPRANAAETGYGFGPNARPGPYAPPPGTTGYGHGTTYEYNVPHASYRYEGDSYSSDGSDDGRGRRGGGRSSTKTTAGGGKAAREKELRSKGRNVGSTSRVAETFNYFDRNRSGYLDYRELRDALEHYGLSVTTPAAREIVAAYDDRPDGMLDIGEFTTLVRDIEKGDTRTSGGSGSGGAKKGTGSTRASSSSASSSSKGKFGSEPLVGRLRPSSSSSGAKKAGGGRSTSSSSAAPKGGGSGSKSASSELEKLKVVASGLGLKSDGSKSELLGRIEDLLHDDYSSAIREPTEVAVDELYKRLKGRS